MLNHGGAAKPATLIGEPLILPVLAAAVAAYAVQVIAPHTIGVVGAQRLLPRWDLASHLGHGWFDYHLLATGRVHRLLWDLWEQAYWPPGLSLWQMPFYLVLGGDMTSGLWSSAAAFVLVAATGAAVLRRADRGAAPLAATLFVAVLVSSPYLLAYATVTMTEMLGALSQLLVLLCYQRWRLQPDASRARWFALALTALFFVKYNYLLMLAVPLVLYEWLERAFDWTRDRHVAQFRAAGRWLASSPAALLLIVYGAALGVILASGGVQFHLLGQRVSIRSIGSSGHVVLYVLLLRLWYLHRRGRIDWERLTRADTRVRPILLWFALPVTVWLASPYPNHLRDVANLVINRPMGQPTLETGAESYLGTLWTIYFYDPWVLLAVLAGFAAAAMRFRDHGPVVRLVILAVPLQFVAMLVHHTRFPRFLLLTVVLLCLAGAAGLAGLVSRFANASVVYLASVLVVVLGMAAVPRIAVEDRFRAVAFEHYTDSPPLRRAFSGIRQRLGPDARLLVVGQSNDLSPALFRWELGPPSGVPSFPSPLGGAARLEPALATHVLLVLPLDDHQSTLDPPTYAPSRFEELMQAIQTGALRLDAEYRLDDLGVLMRLYLRDG